MAASTVTERTSVVLVSSIGTKIYLSSVGYPGHIVTIKDFTGVASQGNPIVVSTTQNVFFADGSISTLLTNPFSFLTVSSKTPYLWQILNNVGFLTTLSNSFVDTLTAENAYLKFVSNGIDVVSTSITQTVNVTKNLTVLGNVDILGNITVNGDVDLFSTINVKETISFSSGLIVNGPVAIPSSLFIRDEMTVKGDVYVGGNVVVGENLYVDNVLRVAQTLVPKNLSVQTLTMNSLNVFGNLQTSESISTDKLFVGDSLTTLSSFLTSNNLIIQGNTHILGDTQIQKTIITSVLEGNSTGIIQKEVSVSSLRVNGTFSTAESLFVGGLLNATSQTNATDVIVTGNMVADNLVVAGNAYISTIRASSLNILGNVSLFENMTTKFLSAANTEVLGNIYATKATVGGILSTPGDLTVLGDMFVGSGVEIKGNAFFQSLSTVSTLVVGGNLSTDTLFVGKNLIVKGDFQIPGTATVGVLAAPIEIVLSTLTLSNTFQVETSASIPIVITNTGDSAFPTTMRIGEASESFTGFMNTPSMNLRGLFQDLNTSINTKDIVHTQISTIENADFLNLFLVGTSNFIQPKGAGLGKFLLGSNSYTLALNTTSAYFNSNSLQFSTNAYGAAFGKDIWVAVGENGEDVSTIRYSADLGTTWKQASSGGFPVQTIGTIPFTQTIALGKDVVFLSTSYLNLDTQGRWIAGGYGGTSATDPLTSLALQYSIDGINWSPYFQGFCNLFEVNRLFVHSFTNPIVGTIVLAGGNRTPSFGISFSENLASWTEAQPVSPGPPFICEDITEDDAKNLYAVGYKGGNSIYVTSEYLYATGWNPFRTSNLPGSLSELKTIAYGNNMFVIGGTPSGGAASNSLYYSFSSSNLANWQRPTLVPTTGFTGTVNRIIYNSNIGYFMAVGSNTGGYNLQISPTGQVWYPFQNPFPKQLFNITPSNASILTPDYTTKYFVTNTETRFESGISTVTLNMSTMTASSITANMILGDASLLTNVNSFGSSIFTSSLFTQDFRMNYSIPSTGVINLVQASTFASTAVFTNAISYPSFSNIPIVNIYATGADTVTSGTVQLTSNNLNWSRASNSVFENYGKSIYGNSNFLVDPNNNTNTSANGVVEPVYVTTGADSRTNYTIQYSRDGFNWSPAGQGGFSNANSDGIKMGNTVTYRRFPFRFLVGGEAPGTMSTIFYSDQGFNFTPVNPSPMIMNSVKVLKSGTQNSVGLNDSNYVIFSRDGITWNQTSTAVQFSAVAQRFDTNAWYGITSNGDLYESIYDGSNFTYYGTTTTNAGFGPPLSNVFELAYGGSLGWVALVSNSPIPYLASFLNPLDWDGSFALPFTKELKSIFFDEQETKFYIGAESSNAQTTLFIGGSNTTLWTQITTGGFSSFTEAFGTGFGITASTSVILAGGTGAFSGGQPPKPQILQVNGVQIPPLLPDGATTSISLSQTNSSNVFKTSVRAVGIASTTAQTYPYVAVGDGQIPQKSIARSSNLTEWLPAITGGFSTGYDVMYYNNQSGTSMWVAVGAAANPVANIQYSPDGANWFATNNSSGIPSGGRAITLLSTASLTRLVAVGEAPFTNSMSEPTNTIVYSDDGFTWLRAGAAQGFIEFAYSIAAGYKSGTSNFYSNSLPPGDYVIAGGSATSVFPYPLQLSQDGISWFPITSPTLSKAAHGIAYGSIGSSNPHQWVVVGENETEGGNTIYYSGNGDSWFPANNSPFTIGYDVTYIPGSNLFAAVGKSLSNTLTIAYSGNGKDWVSLGSGGFSNAETLGSANGIYAQSNDILDQNPFIQLPNFIAYSREIPRPYLLPTLRTYSTNIVLNEAMTIGISSVVINSNAGIGASALTVQGNIQTSTLVYKSSEPTPNPNLSSLVVSSLQFGTTAIATIFETPSWAFGTLTKPNVIDYAVGSASGRYVNLNQTVYVSDGNRPLTTGKLGINTDDPGAFIPTSMFITDVSGTVVTSSITTSMFRFRGGLVLNNLESTYIASPNLSITTKETLTPSKNTIYSEVSSLQFNGIMTVQQSTQRVGCYTTNPQFDFDVRANGFLSSLITQKVNTNLVFFTLQSL